MTFHILLKEYRNRSGLSIIDLAKKLGLKTGAYLGNIEAGRQKAPTVDRIIKMADILKLSKAEADEFIKVGISERLPKKDFTILSGMVSKGGAFFGEKISFTTDEPKRIIPVFDASCGKFIDWTDGSYPARHYPEVEHTDSRDPNAFYVRAHGDSMTGRADDKRTIFDGDLLLVEPNTPLMDGDIVFSRIDGQGVIVKKYKKEKNVIRLIPLNDKYPIQDVTAKDEPRVFPITEIKRKLRR